MNILDTGVRNVRNVANFEFGPKCWLNLKNDIDQKKSELPKSRSIAFIDQKFVQKNNFSDQICSIFDDIEFVNTDYEPSTNQIDFLMNNLISKNYSLVCGIGGGIVLDTAKAVSNLLTNGGSAEDYQGWDLLRKPGIYKVGVPTISGTGAEATRTCVMTNHRTKLKLGMNSDYTVYDKIYLDPQLTRTVPREQYFYTAMDAYIHCMEALSGSYRNPVGDAFSNQCIALCREIFLGEQDMMSDENRSKLMVASYLGGIAIAASYVGVVHPLSAGLSVVFGTHHCVGNCIVMRAMSELYPDYYHEFWRMVEKAQVTIPKLNIPEAYAITLKKLREYSIMHEKPLYNALGENYEQILDPKYTSKLFGLM